MPDADTSFPRQMNHNTDNRGASDYSSVSPPVPPDSFSGRLALYIIPYRTVYTVRFKAPIYVLHAFQKKAKQGITTPKLELELVRRKLRAAQQHYADTYGER